MESKEIIKVSLAERLPKASIQGRMVFLQYGGRILIVIKNRF